MHKITQTHTQTEKETHTHIKKDGEIEIDRYLGLHTCIHRYIFAYICLCVDVYVCVYVCVFEWCRHRVNGARWLSVSRLCDHKIKSSEETWCHLAQKSRIYLYILLIIAQNNVISTNYIKAKIVETDKTVNHIKSECIDLTQKKYKLRHDRLRKVIDWELCKRLKFDNITKWHWPKPETVLENETHKILRDFEIQTKQSSWSEGQTKKTKKICHQMDFAVPVDHRVKINKSEKIDKYLVGWLVAVF